MIKIIGLIAAVCTTCSFLPQALKIIKSKNTQGVSLGMYIIFVAGVCLWLIYGFMIKDLPLISANCVTLGLSSIILIYKIRYK